MRLSLCVCLTAAFILRVEGQITGNETVCKGVEDFSECNPPGEIICPEEVSKCFCKSETPYCRCNNYIDEFYLGKNCDQQWTTLNFALVASIPGLCLALIVGVAVGVTVYLSCSSKRPSPRSGNVGKASPPAEEDLFPGMVFASDMTGHPNSPPARTAPTQGGIPMTNAGSVPYSMQNNTRPPPTMPQTGGPQRSYSPSPDMLPSSPRGGNPVDRPRAGGPPYSYNAGPGQVLSNPYTSRSGNPYEEYSPSPNNYSRSANENMRESQHSSQPYGGSDYSNSQNAFPRAQFSRHY